MNVTQTQPKPTGDLAPRSYSAHVNLSKRGQEIVKRESPIRLTVPELEANGLAPSVYTVLVSRIENRGAGDTTAVDELADWLDQRLPRISEQARRRIMSLPEYEGAGLTPEFDSMARQMAARLRTRNEASTPNSQPDSITQSMLSLLKHPLFAAYMKDQQVRIAMYGPRGFLRAS
jgi:hypothetical protein